VESLVNEEYSVSSLKEFVVTSDLEFKVCSIDTVVVRIKVAVALELCWWVLWYRDAGSGDGLLSIKGEFKLLASWASLWTFEVLGIDLSEASSFRFVLDAVVLGLGAVLNGFFLQTFWSLHCLLDGLVLQTAYRS